MDFIVNEMGEILQSIPQRFAFSDQSLGDLHRPSHASSMHKPQRFSTGDQPK
jgi:hypothetical protein